MANIITSGALLPSTADTPLDARTRVETLADVANMQNPELGGIFYCVETGKHYKITALTSKTIGAIDVENTAVDTYEALPDAADLHAHTNKTILDKIGESESGKPTYNDNALATSDDILEWSHGLIQITEVADNIATLSGTNVPVGVRTNSGTYYPIEKGSVVIDITNGQIKLDVTPYLAYDNAASFTGPWTVYYAAGSKGDKGDNALSFQIGTVTTLAAGASATAEAAISDEGLVTLNLGIPQGANGADGQDGSDGEDADATAAIDAHNSDASAHTAIQNKFASYLPLAGGTMTGVINRNGALVQNTVSGGSVSLIASHTGATEKGAALYLWDEANSTYPGYFILRAGHTSGYSDLRGTAPGGLTWRGASLIGECSKTMNGYTKLPNGIIIQWGSTSSTASSVSATFPVAFTAAPIVIPHSPSDGVDIAVSATTTSATFTISSGSINVRYIAIGY